MVTTWFRILVGVMWRPRLLAWALSKSSLRAPGVEHVLTVLGNPRDEGPGPRLDVLRFDEGG